MDTAEANQNFREELIKEIVHLISLRGIIALPEYFKYAKTLFLTEALEGIRECQNAITSEEYDDIDVMTVMGFNHSEYNSKVRDEMMNVIELIGDGKYNSDISQQLNLSETHVELIQYLLCDRELAEYGTSPRGCWLTGMGIALFDVMKKYAAIRDAAQT